MPATATRSANLRPRRPPRWIREECICSGLQQSSRSTSNSTPPPPPGRWEPRLVHGAIRVPVRIEPLVRTSVTGFAAGTVIEPVDGRGRANAVARSGSQGRYRPNILDPRAALREPCPGRRTFTSS
jgi:hypothetical protein